MKKAQLASVITIVLLVAAVAGFLIFSKYNVGRAPGDLIDASRFEIKQKPLAQPTPVPTPAQGGSMVAGGGLQIQSTPPPSQGGPAPATQVGGGGSTYALPTPTPKPTPDPRTIKSTTSAIMTGCKWSCVEYELKAYSGKASKSTLEKGAEWVCLEFEDYLMEEPSYKLALSDTATLGIDPIGTGVLSLGKTALMGSWEEHRLGCRFELTLKDKSGNERLRGFVEGSNTLSGDDREVSFGITIPFGGSGRTPLAR